MRRNTVIATGDPVAILAVKSVNDYVFYGAGIVASTIRDYINLL